VDDDRRMSSACSSTPPGWATNIGSDLSQLPVRT
jgi:hypothetical protein